MRYPYKEYLVEIAHVTSTVISLYASCGYTLSVLDMVLINHQIRELLFPSSDSRFGKVALEILFIRHCANGGFAGETLAWDQDLSLRV